MLITLKTLKRFFLGWIIYSIIITVLVFSILFRYVDIPNLLFLKLIIFVVCILNFIIGLATYPTWYLLRGKSLLFAIPIAFLVHVVAAFIGNLVCYYLSEYIFHFNFYESKTDHLVELLIFLVPVFALSTTINYLKYKSNFLENVLHDTNKKIVQDKANNSMSFKVGERYCRIDFDKLLYLSSHGKRTTFHTIEKDYTASQLLKDIEKQLPDDFIRIHRQYIINIKHLREIRYYEGGRYTAYLNDEDESMLPVSRKIAPQLKEKLGI